MSEIAQYYTSGKAVYARIFKLTSGKREVWSFGASSWDAYSSASVADYGTLASEEGSTGNYVLDISTTIAPHGEPRWIEWYERIDSSLQKESDPQIASYMLSYDSVLSQFLAPVQIVGYETHPSDMDYVRDSNLRTVNDQPVESLEDLGAVTSTVHKELDFILPTGVTWSSTRWEIPPNLGHTVLLRDSVDLDLTKTFSNLRVSIVSALSTANVWIGFFGAASDINNVDNDLILPGDLNTSKDLMKAGVIVGGSGSAYEIYYITSGSYGTNSLGGPVNNTIELKFSWDKTTLEVYSITHSAVLSSVVIDKLPDFNGSGIRFGVAFANSTFGSLYLTPKPYAVGEGFRGENKIYNLILGDG